MSEQEIDAEVIRYEPRKASLNDTYYWTLDESDWNHRLSARIFGALAAGLLYFHGCRDYPTREAAFADLRNAIRLTGTNAAQE